MTCVIGVIVIAGLSYVASGGRAETRFALVLSLLIIFVLFALSPLHFSPSDVLEAGRQSQADLELDSPNIGNIGGVRHADV